MTLKSLHKVIYTVQLEILAVKFGCLAVGEVTVKFKSVKFKCDLRIYVLFYVCACACAHIICTELLPNLNPPIFLFWALGTKPPNLKIANISGYTVCTTLTSYDQYDFATIHLVSSPDSTYEREGLVTSG